MSRRPARTQERSEGRSASCELRLFGRSIDRLTLRLTAGIAVIVLVPLGLGYWALSHHHYERNVAVEREAARIQSRVLEVALRHQMVEKDVTLMTSMLSEIGASGNVRRAMILNHEGQVRIASDPSLVGEIVPRESPTCFVCHAKDAQRRSDWVVLDDSDGKVLRTVLPIENRKECQVCHGTTNRLNGILICDTSLAPLQAELDHDTLLFLAGTIGLAVLLLGGTGLLVRRLILARLARLRSAVRSMASGDLDQRVRDAGDDAIASLSSDFNRMAQTTSSLLGEIRQQEAQLANIMNSLDDGLVVLDGDSRVVAANRSFSRRVGTHTESLRGQRCHDGSGGTLPCCLSGADCPAARCRATGEVQRAIFRSLDDDGHTKPIEEVYASPVFDENGNVVQVVEIWRDITTRVEEEERLAEIEHLVSLGTLASGFSHEVSTPLASMLTCSESMIGQIDDIASNGRPLEELVGALRENAVIVREQVMRCRNVTQQFLRFSRGIPPSVEPLDLESVVRNVVALAQPTAREAHVDVVVECGGALPPVRANAEVVQHAVLNLLVNAIQSFEKRRGTIHVRVLAGDGVCIQVEDQGCGISPQARAHLFEPFQSRKPGGTGLGLFLSRTFLQRFGGDVRLAHTTPGAGSCFEIVFAAASEVVS